MNNVINRFGCLIVFLCLVCLPSAAQEGAIDYNTYYAYPVSVGIEYQNLTPFGEYGSSFQAYDLSTIVRVPLPFLPVLQPLFQGGLMFFDSRDAVSPDKWDHTHWYGSVGISYTNRFLKNFEVGGELALGLSESIFPNLDPEQSRSAPYFLASIGGRISLDPSYNMSIDIHPNLKFLRAMNPLQKFNGIIFSIGFAANYRFGEDPDASQAIIRSIRFAEPQISDLYAAMQSYYVENPVGEVQITNTESYPIYNVSVAFFQQDFMDSPTIAKVIPELGPGESQSIKLLASFNSNVFTTEGITPLTGEILADYSVRNKAAHQSFPISYYLHDKTALTWDDDRKVAAFITQADSALRNFTSFVRQTCKNEEIPGFAKNLQTAMQVYSGLTEIGCLYQIDPTSPFTTAQDNPQVVDSISLPRYTLKRATGDCDDLTVLFCSLLETAGIETGFITVPGHIYAAFNTKVASRDYLSVHPDKNMTLNVEGELWVPVEITMLGSDDFLAAWRKGIEEYRALDERPEDRQIHFTRIAQTVYWPVGLRETDLGLQYGSSSNIVYGFENGINRLTDTVLADYYDRAIASDNKRAYNRLGIAAARFGRYPDAEKAFNTALTLDRNYLSANINLGTLWFLREEYHEALKSFHQAEEVIQLEEKEKTKTYTAVLVNISRSYYELENFDMARDYHEKILSLDPSMAGEYAYLASDQAGTRSAEVSGSSAALFVGEEE